MRRRPLPVLVLAALVVGVLGGVVWSLLADPAVLQVRDEGIVLTEQASTAEFGVTLVFLAVGTAVGLGLGAAVGRLRLGPRGVAVTVVLTVVAAVAAYGTGRLLGPSDPAAATGLQTGDTVAQQLAVGGLMPLVAWAIPGLLGFIVVTALGRRADVPADVPAPR